MSDLGRGVILSVVLIERGWRRRHRLPEPLRAELAAQSPWLWEEVRGTVTERGGRGPAYRSSMEIERARFTVVGTRQRLLVWGLGARQVDIPPGHRSVTAWTSVPDRVHLAFRLEDFHRHLAGEVEVMLRTERAESVATFVRG